MWPLDPGAKAVAMEAKSVGRYRRHGQVRSSPSGCDSAAIWPTKPWCAAFLASWALETPSREAATGHLAQELRPIGSPSDETCQSLSPVPRVVRPRDADGMTTATETIGPPRRTFGQVASTHRYGRSPSIGRSKKGLTLIPGCRSPLGVNRRVEMGSKYSFLDDGGQRGGGSSKPGEYFLPELRCAARRRRSAPPCRARDVAGGRGAAGSSRYRRGRWLRPPPFPFAVRQADHLRRHVAQLLIPFWGCPQGKCPQAAASAFNGPSRVVPFCSLLLLLAAVCQGVHRAQRRDSRSHQRSDRSVENAQ